jgi:hypothetical protein
MFKVHLLYMGIASYWMRYMKGFKDPEHSWHDCLEGLEVWYSFCLCLIHAGVLNLSFEFQLSPTPALYGINNVSGIVNPLRDLPTL